MKHLICLLTIVLLLSACYNKYDEVYYEEVETELTPHSPRYQRLTTNIRVKEEGDRSVVYEYRHARIDELAFLASKYCFSRYEADAHLQDIKLNNANNRLATFHCMNLQ